jgi:glutathione S-transferase
VLVCMCFENISRSFTVAGFAHKFQLVQKMKLYHTPSSPPSRSVLMALRCLELDVDVEIVDLVKRENRTVEFLKINPLGQVPVLVDGDVVVTESRAIMAYLANSRSSDKFYPSDARKRAIIDSRLYFDATVFFMNIVAALVRRGEKNPAKKLLKDNFNCRHRSFLKARGKSRQKFVRN